MSLEILPKIFGSNNRAKLLRLFLFNQDSAFSREEIIKRTKINKAQIKKEISLLEDLEIIKVRQFVQPGNNKSLNKKNKTESFRGKVWQLNLDFFFIEHLQALFNAEFFANREELAKRFKNCGKIKLIILSGIFMQAGGERADLLIVGDELKRKLLEKTVRDIESEIGRELVFAILETNDFMYRIHSSDRFVRDILDYPNKRIIDKLTLI